ncbi:MAG: CAP domain-containing protein [Candidatus Binatia bacterium]
MKRYANIVVLLAATALLALLSTPSSGKEPEDVLIERINHVRMDHGLRPLAYAGDQVRQVARSYSERMLARGFFAHRDDQGQTAGDRLTTSGVDWRVVGENLLEDVGTASSDVVVDEAIDAWLQSPGHRANILSDRYTQTAIGFASNGGRTYLTQLFLAR